MTHKGTPFQDAIGGSNQNQNGVKSSDEDDDVPDLIADETDRSDDDSGSINGSDYDSSDDGSGDSDGSDDGSCDSGLTSPSVDEDEQSEDDELTEHLKAKWRSQKYVSGTRARFEDDLAKMKRWIHADAGRRKRFLPLLFPFSDEICIQYLNFEMRRKINTKGDLLAPGTIYQVQQMLKYEGEQTHHRSG